MNHLRYDVTPYQSAFDQIKVAIRDHGGETNADQFDAVFRGVDVPLVPIKGNTPLLSPFCSRLENWIHLLELMIADGQATVIFHDGNPIYAIKGEK